MLIYYKSYYGYHFTSTIIILSTTISNNTVCKITYVTLKPSPHVLVQDNVHHDCLALTTGFAVEDIVHQKTMCIMIA